MSIRSKLAGATLLTLSAAFSSAAHAQTDTTTFRVLIQIIESCTISDIAAPISTSASTRVAQ
ncbi:hypothetical protein V8Z80_05255 [Orrella sp. JC864]|uniref:hypothetical protein n=1 Tax=Orrella sp. JC864 TaxID=3120298 RepID=UPI003008807E